MIRFPVCVAAVLCLATTGARAALQLQIGPRNGTGRENRDAWLQPADVTQFFDLVFHETGPVQREGLFTYDIALNLDRGNNVATSFVSGPGTTPVQLGPNPAIAMTPNPASITVLESTPTRLVFNVTSGNDLTDIDEGETAARIFYTAVGNPTPGISRITFDVANTVFGSGDPELPLSIEVALTDEGSIDYIPEPSGLVLASGAAAALVLWRRRA